ncbi:MAG: tRNA lysidine(34) synthetase TilS [Bauldia sp.]|nr:tRNA lysidine(34) synthetase TilS [Bauldia sp.]
MPAAEQPVGAGEAADLFRPLEGLASVALAVSGGPDSIALLTLVAAWRRTLPAGPAVHVLTVDHGLRAGSAAEAESVVAAAASLGMPGRVLTWTGAKPETGIEEAARAARYRLLTDAARALGASRIVTAHHLDDQAETFLMRLARGSGPFGLAGMRSVADLDGVTLFRPLLGIGKARLVATAEAAGVPFVADPMNEDIRFERVRWRSLAPALAAEGLDAKRLGQAASRMARVADALNHFAGALIRRSVAVDDLATARLDRAAYAADPVEVRLRALTRLLGALGGGRFYPPRQEHLEALDRALAAANGEGAPFRRTLARVVVDAHSGAEAVFYREIGRAAPAPLPVGGGFRGVWDNRFAIAIDGAGEGGLTLAPLGREGLAALGFVPHAVPKAALMALPGLHRGQELLAAPGVLRETAVNLHFACRSVLAERLLAA